MDMKEVKDLLQEILRSDISEFELEHTGTRIRLRRSMQAAEVSLPSAGLAVNDLPAVPPAAPTVIDSRIATQVARKPEDDGLHIVTSPIVGTFYRASSPGSDPFVKVGSMVEEGSTLCIVEAMKLMNEIPSDVSGEIVTIYADNSQPVEYGQKLFGIRMH